MLTIELLAVGKLKEKWLREAMAEYSKRLSGYCRFAVTELDEARLPENPSAAEISAALENEAAAIAAKAGKAPIVAMCIEGGQLDSPQLAEWLERLMQTESKVCFIIGGSHGLAPKIKQQARLCLSVSPMTFPHQLFRVMLTEQLYRAMSILGGGRYHK